MVQWGGGNHLFIITGDQSEGNPVGCLWVKTFKRSRNEFPSTFWLPPPVAYTTNTWTSMNLSLDSRVWCSNRIINYKEINSPQKKIQSNIVKLAKLVNWWRFLINLFNLTYTNRNKKIKLNIYVNKITIYKIHYFIICTRTLWKNYKLY